MYKIERIYTNVDAAAIDLGIRRFERHLSAETGYRRARFLVSLLNDIALNQADELLEKYRVGQPKALYSLDALHLVCDLPTVASRVTRHPTRSSEAALSPPQNGWPTAAACALVFCGEL